MVSLAQRKFAVAALASAAFAEEEGVGFERSSSKVVLPSIKDKKTREAVKEFTSSRRGGFKK